MGENPGKMLAQEDFIPFCTRDGGHNAIELGDDRIPIIDDEKCVGCGICKEVCPVDGCISIKEK
jgi:NAD-dependent dihydropyrimidine dehydrogenase PreA subunit